MVRQRVSQYSVRNVPARVDQSLRQRARSNGKSLNDVVLEALERGTDLSSHPVLCHDLDALAGTWVEDPGFDDAIALQHRVDAALWK